jgi:uncharacterized protein
MTLPTIQFRDIPDDGLAVDAPLSASWLGGQLEGTGIEPARDPAGVAHLRLDKSGRDVIVSGTVEAAVRAECVRCLEPVSLDLRTTFSLTLRPRPPAEPERVGGRDDIELEAQELDEDYYEHDRIELGRWVREQILLEAPSFPSCPAGCAQPLTLPVRHDAGTQGAAEIDPRLAPLKKLAKKE